MQMEKIREKNTIKVTKYFKIRGQEFGLKLGDYKLQSEI